MHLYFTLSFPTFTPCRGVGCIFTEMISGVATFPGSKDSVDQLDKIFRVSLPTHTVSLIDYICLCFCPLILRANLFEKWLPHFFVHIMIGRIKLSRFDYAIYCFIQDGINRLLPPWFTALSFHLFCFVVVRFWSDVYLVISSHISTPDTFGLRYLSDQQNTWAAEMCTGVNYLFIISVACLSNCLPE